MKLREQVEQLQQADRVSWATTEVECVAGQLLHVLLGKQKRVNKIVDDQDVTHLFAVAVNRYRFAVERSNDEVRDPTLIFVAVLVRPVNAAHAKDERRNSIGPRVLNDVLIRRAFRATVRTMKVERAVFGDASFAN